MDLQKKHFKDYAEYYDSFYKEKDYDAEVDFILKLYEKFGNKGINSVLDIGCGTGGHLIPLSKRKLKVKGFDTSEEMIEIASNKISKADFDGSCEVEIGDILDFRDSNVYDLVIAMFAVMGYLKKDEDILKALETVKAHLAKGGLFIFDVWFGPAVLHLMPETRVQEFKHNNQRILRIARPELDVSENLVRINYNLIRFISEREIDEISELHKVRYYFINDLKVLLNKAGFSLDHTCPFMEINTQPTIKDWNISIIAKKL